MTDRSQEARSRINHAVDTRDEASYCCYLDGATGLQKAMSFGHTPQSDATRTTMAGGHSRSGNEVTAATGQSGRSAGVDCNALLRAAGRCVTIIPEAKLP